MAILPLIFQKTLRRLYENAVIGQLKMRPVTLETFPFRHVVLDSFFPPTFYQTLSKEFQAIKNRGLWEDMSDQNVFARLRGYDAYIWNIPPRKESPFLFFYSREWRDYITGLFQLNCSNDTHACLHHHKKGSEGGWVHSDFSRVVFADDPISSGMNPWYFQCKNQQDEASPGTHVTVRSVVLIYFLNNAPWQKGGGGETGLFLNRDPSSLVKKVAPINNRLFAFEISPDSNHAFLKNILSERNSLIQWFHQDLEIISQRYDTTKLASWKNYPA